MREIHSLYPQYNSNIDRRQQSTPVLVERRSGNDRRNQQRFQLDPKLTRDIFQVKDVIKDITSNLKLDSNLTLNSNATNFSAINNMAQDQYTKTEKVTVAQELAKMPEPPSKSFQIGVLSLALLSAMFTPFVGPTGAVIAVGATLYVGAKVLKQALLTQALNKNKNGKTKK